MASGGLCFDRAYAAPWRNYGGTAQDGRVLKRWAPRTKTGGKNPPVIVLAEVGIDKDLAKQARKFAALSEDKFEALVERRAEAVSSIS